MELPTRKEVAKELHDRSLDNIKDTINNSTANKVIVTPLEFLFTVYNNPKIDIKTRVDAAKSSLKHMHPSMPTPVEISGPNEGAIEVNLKADDALNRLNDILDLAEREAEAIIDPFKDNGK